ncbi:hypothetical protein D9619_008207 [Psilocybe cf. subviscida]|uniref:Uncharacterized protein n=1 Tax=Psilocybe cf. subviscida TaxID=2480587 RepID=A0A8H5AT68_9AGAR|nr:hypothetical protein D9619_008207 [Psilocybe cf. subviscida]
MGRVGVLGGLQKEGGLGGRKTRKLLTKLWRWDLDDNAPDGDRMWEHLASWGPRIKGKAQATPFSSDFDSPLLVLPLIPPHNLSTSSPPAHRTTHPKPLTSRSYFLHAAHVTPPRITKTNIGNAPRARR